MTDTLPGPRAYFTISLSGINDLMASGMMEAINRAKHAHHTDIVLRIEGKDVHIQADWIKHLQLLAFDGMDGASRYDHKTVEAFERGKK